MQSTTSMRTARRQTKRKRDASDSQADQDGRTSNEVGLMRNGLHTSSGSRFVGSASGIHFVRAVYNMLGQDSAPSSANETTSPHDVVPGEDDELAENDHQQGPTPSDPGQNEASEFWYRGELGNASLGKPHFDDLLIWTKNYFKNWHAIFPFIHAPSLLDVLANVGAQGLATVSNADQVIIRAVVSLSLQDSRQTLGNRFRPSKEYVFRDVKHAIADVSFTFCEPATIHNVQALVAVQLLFISMLKFNLASRLGGMIARMAFNLGLHRCPSRFSHFKPLEIEIRRRLFFCIYCLDRILSQSLGLPLAIQDSDIDVCYPGEEKHGVPKNREDAPEIDGKQLLVLTLFSKHARLRGMILELRNKSLAVRHDTAEQAQVIETALYEWSNKLHEVLDDLSESSHEDSPISPSHKLCFKLLEHESLIALNRPLITIEEGSSDSAAALQSCIKASRSIIKVLDEYCATQSDNSSTRDLRLNAPLTWPLITWCVWMSCFILAFAALEGKSQTEFAVKCADRSLRILAHVGLRKTRWPTICASAVAEVKIALLRQTSKSLDANPRLDLQINTGRALSARQSSTNDPVDPAFNETSSSATQLPDDSRAQHKHNDASRRHTLTSSTRRSPALISDSTELMLGGPSNFDITSGPSMWDLVQNQQDDELLDPFMAIDFSNFTNAAYLPGFGNDFL